MSFEEQSRQDLSEQLPDEPTENPERLSYTDIYPDAGDLVASAVYDTLKQGDFYQRIPSLHWRNITVQGILPVAVCSEAVVASGQVNPSALAGSVLGLSTIWLLNRYTDKAAISRIAASDNFEKPGIETLSTQTGQRLELMTTPAKETEAIWYGVDHMAFYLERGKPFPKAKGWSQEEHLREVVDMARDADVSVLHVTWGALQQLPKEVEPQVADTKQSLPRLLWSTKRLVVHDERFVASLTPDEWEAVLDDVRPQTIERSILQPSDTLKALGTKLAGLQPEHPLASLLTKLELPDDIADMSHPNIIRTAARTAIENRLDRIELYPETFKEAMRGETPARKDIALASEHGRLSHDGRSVRWQTKYGPVEQDVLSAVELGEEMGSFVNPHGVEQGHAAKMEAEGLFAKLLNAPEKVARQDTTRTIIALEVAISNVCHGLDVPFQATEREESVTEPIRAQELLETTLQERLRENRHPLRRHRMVQAGAILLGGALLGGTSYFLHERAESYEAQTVRQATATLATERDSSPSLIPESDAKDYAYKHDPFLRKWHYVTAVDGAIGKTWAELFPDAPVVAAEGPSEYPSSINTDTFSVGNVLRKDDTPDYKLTAYNGANTAGFWASDTSHELRIVRYENEGTMVPEWAVTRDNLIGGLIQLVPSELPKEYVDKPVIRVHRYLKSYIQLSESAGELGDADDNDAYGNNMISIPVLEGTVPVAASLDGKPVQLYRKPDNTYAVQTTNGKAVQGKLDFWLAPSPAAPRVRALGPLTITGHTELLGPRTAKMVEGWKTKLPDDHGATANRIENTWKYTFTPFPANLTGWKSFDAFEDQATDLRKANCNVANTIANLRMPKENATFGYNNSAGSKADTLSSKELHQRMTNYDATPSVRVEGQEPTVIIIPDLPYGWILAGAGVLIQRRRVEGLVRATGRHVVDAADNRIDRHRAQRYADIPRDTYATTLALSQYVTYAGHVPTADKLARAIDRVDAEHQDPGYTLAEQRHYATEDLGPLFKTIARSNKADATVREAARTSRTVLKAVEGKRDLLDKRRVVASLLKSGLWGALQPRVRYNRMNGTDLVR